MNQFKPDPKAVVLSSVQL